MRKNPTLAEGDGEGEMRQVASAGEKGEGMDLLAWVKGGLFF